MNYEQVKEFYKALGVDLDKCQKKVEVYHRPETKYLYEITESNNSQKLNFITAVIVLEFDDNKDLIEMGVEFAP